MEYTNGSEGRELFPMLKELRRQPIEFVGFRALPWSVEQANKESRLRLIIFNDQKDEESIANDTVGLTL